MTIPRYAVEKEYEILRAELVDGKKYVFERPFLIITGALASIQLVANEYAILFAPIVVCLLSFNFWFTVNRMGSMARIIAYIVLILDDQDSPWFGWETSLRKYRKWLKIDKLGIRKIPVSEDAASDSLRFYPVIFYIHVIANWLIVALSVAYTVLMPCSITFLIVIITLISVCVFTYYANNNSPGILRLEIEQNRIVWKKVFKNWNTL